MTLVHPHRWDLTPLEAQELQGRLASLVVAEDELSTVRHIAGLELAHSRFSDQLTVAIAVVTFPELVPVILRVQEVATRFPFIPELASFREVPGLVALLEGLELKPDLVLVGGPGTAHPRRLGVAAHLGVLTGLPTIGCARASALGTYVEPEVVAGSSSALVSQGEIIGTVYRSKNRVAPLFVSTGHRVSREEAARWVALLCRGYRLPEPLRYAAQAIAEGKQETRRAAAG